MGTSTNGILIFGFDMGEDDPMRIISRAINSNDPNILTQEEALDFDDDGDLEDVPCLEDVILEEAGLSEPDHSLAWDDPVYQAAKKAADAAIAACPVDIETYCSGDYPMYIVAVRGTGTTVHRGDVKEIDVSGMQIEKGRVAAFEEWCRNHGLDYQEPRWLLCSYWS